MRVLMRVIWNARAECIRVRSGGRLLIPGIAGSTRMQSVADHLSNIGLNLISFAGAEFLQGV